MARLNAKYKMAQFRKKPVVIEAITFEEFVDFAKQSTEAPHWSIPYNGVNVTHENDTCYLIPTLEGTHNFTPEDMLITGIKGEIYPCKKDIFQATYDLAEKTNQLNFGQAIEALKQGNLIQRQGWNGKGMFIVKQIPAVIGIDIIPKMQSLPQSAKDVLIARNQPINYENQMLIVNSSGKADSWVPSSSDIFAEDWYILD